MTMSKGYKGWLPHTWEQFTGNGKATRRFKKLAKRLRWAIENGVELNRSVNNQFLSGPSRSGKTALVKFLIRCIVCERYDRRASNPCDGTCPACKNFLVHDYDEELFSYLRAEERGVIPVNLVMIDCGKIPGPREFQIRLDQIKNRHGMQIVYLDEAQNLVTKDLEKLLVKEVEERPYLWVFSTTEPVGFTDVFKSRNSMMLTELPQADELAAWIKERCVEDGVRFEPAGVMRLVERCNCVPGTALSAITDAGLDPDEGLTVDFVENEWIPPHDA